MAEPQRQPLSPDNPWPGLDTFVENDQDYFYGRAVESAELLRLVRREPLTVLFGRSGLGKSSLLMAGLFPRLRRESFLPVYVRLDHAVGAPALREQVFRELRAACETEKVQAIEPAENESLWSYFHRREVEFWSERNRPMTPVLVLDQFEEIFTLGQETEESRARSAAFLEELGDLVENRPPEKVRRALEADPMAARSFDFKGSTVKLVLSFREDFLAEMEGLKGRMPSLMHNRFRLLAMNSDQAYEVITCAGGALVSDDVALRIIRLAWKNDPSLRAISPKIEIDPALLSVVCSELNQKRRLAQPPLDRITPALLEGADREILAGFYERGMVDLDPRVRTFVEDELITQRGYRDSYDLGDALTLPGISSDALDSLIRRRLLRVDERQSARRLELTHDVLTRVVKESRDSRRGREAEMAARIREELAREQQRRNRRNAALVVAGAIVVVVLVVLAGWLALEARRLLKEAELRRLMATSDRLESSGFDSSLLVNLEALRDAPSRDAADGLLRHFLRHPQLSTYLWGHTSGVKCVAFSPDGKQLASASWDGTVILWDVDRRKILATLRGHTSPVQGVAFSPNGKRLATASADNTVILWDVDSHKPLATLKGHKDWVMSVAFSPDGKRLASASQDKAVILWDVNSLKALARMEGHKDSVRGVAFSPDGKRLASASEDKTVIVWDSYSGKRLATLRGRQGALWSLAFSPDGKRLATTSEDKAVTVWDVDSRKPLTRLEGHRDWVMSAAFSPDGKQLASASADKTVIVWDLETYEPLRTLEGHSARVLAVAFSPGGKVLASASQDGAVILWEIGGRKPLVTLEAHRNAVDDIAFNPEGKLLASASQDKTVILWDMRRLKPLATLEGHRAPVEVVVFSPDGKWLASESRQEGLVTLWDVNTQKPLGALEGHENWIYGIAFSADGKQLAGARADKTVVLWDVNSRKPLANLRGHLGEVRDVTFSPDGKQLASASVDRSVILWDVDRRKPIAKLKGHKGPVLSIAFSPQGKRLASASSDRTVILWDVESPKALATLEGHKGMVSSVAFSPNGKRLASAGGDDTVILWDVASGKPLARLEGDRVYSVAFSPDGKLLASASESHTVMLWNLAAILDVDFLRAEACRRANRNLNCREWRAFISADEPYHKTCEALPGPPEKCE